MDHTGCVLALVGSRDVSRIQAEALFEREILEHKPRTVVSGGAKGADTVAIEVARRLLPEADRIVYRPTVFEWNVPRPTKITSQVWNSQGDLVITIDGGFKQRDEKIAEAADCLVRVASSTTKTYGSGWTADYAERLGKRVTRHVTPEI